ncbi:MAG TPA: protein kinase [Thermoanaerobaculia bacterium]|nr:protein kinase [Thermoanaerobaculia bacterium]
MERERGAISIQPGTRLGPYEVVSLLGAGGMGEVYRARDPRLLREVAIKTIAPHLAGGPEALARFQREARTIAALTHPNILAIFDVGTHENVWFLVTELLEGETLSERLSRTVLPWAKAVEIAAAVAEGLADAHAHGIVHRDLKPGNLFLTSEGRLKILDFGLARRIPSAPGARDTEAPTLAPSTQAGAISGTVLYMSPEQVEGRPLDARSDIFSLGSVLYEMLVGRPPFPSESPGGTMAAILRDPPAPIPPGRQALPAGLDRVVWRCLEKNPDERFQSARDLAFALRAFFSGAAPAVEEAAGRPGPPSVAVLPFRNLSADPENEFFTDGILEDVIAHLSKIRSLKVISRTSVMPFRNREKSLREIGTTLGAAAVLEGSVRRAGNRVRIVAQLVDVRTDENLWAETYDRELDDIFAIQTDVSFQIAAALQAELSHDERKRIQRTPTRDLHAYQLFLQGRYCYTRYTDEGIRKGIGYFEEAIAADPEFALAYAGLALAYAELGQAHDFGSVKPAESYDRARAAVAKALALDDALGEAHGVVALLKFVSEYDWSGAEREFRLALELSPGSADIHDHYGWLCSALERYDDAIRLVKRARELDPLTHRSDLANELLRAGRIEEALELAERLVEFEPGNPRGHSISGWAHLSRGRTREGLAALERAAALTPESALFLAQLGQAYGMTGQEAKARESLARLRDLSLTSYVSPYLFAYVHTGLGESDLALDWLEKAYEQRSGPIYGIKGSFLFRSLRSHPRFVALLRRMNLA